MDTTPSTIIKQFYTKYRQKQYVKGEILVQPSADSLPPITYIQDGLIGQCDFSETGDKVVLNIFKPGAFFPVPSAVNHTYNKFYYEALTNCTVRQASAAEIEVFLREQPDVVYDLLQRVYKGTDGLLGHLALLLGGTTNARVLYELFINAERFGEKMPGGIAIDITTAELAQQTGLARETVSRELQKLKDDGKVTLSRGRIVVRTQEEGNL